MQWFTIQPILTLKDQFDHENMVFSKDLMLHDDEEQEDCEIIDYDDNILIQFDKKDKLIVAKGERKLSNSKCIVIETLFPIQTKGSY